MLYDMVEVTMDFQVSRVAPTYAVHTHRRVSALGRDVGGMWWTNAHKGWPLLYALRTWSDAKLTFAKHVKVKVLLTSDWNHGMDTDELVTNTNHTLYSLCSYLNTNKCLKHLEIEV